DKIAQASFDALVTLFDAIPDEDLQWTRAQNPAAFLTIVGIQRFYVLELERRGLGSRATLRRYYDAARLSILNTIVETTPMEYRSGDARYLIGAILWRQGNAGEARRWWNGISIDPSDSYVSDYSRILELLRAGPLDVRAVNQSLNAERGRWLSFSATRLRHF